MHYGDPEQEQANGFEILIRKCSTAISSSSFQLGSIIRCQYIHPNSLYQFFLDCSKGKPFNKYIKNALPDCSWYKCTFKDNFDSFELTTTEAITNIEFSEQGLYQFVIYKHSTSGRKSKPWYQMTSVQECRGINSAIISNFLIKTYNHQRRFQRLIDKQLRNKPYEHWYLFEMAVRDRGGFKVVSVQDIKEVSNDTSFLRLH